MSAEEASELSDEKIAFLESLIPRVAEPKPTQQQSEQGGIIYWADPTY
jgi:hypothetical protein